MINLRYFLKNILKALSIWAIKKHQIELIVVSGWYGTEVTREMLYTILNTKLKVRRMVRNSWWDLSVPLTILGYKDEKRSAFAWIRLVIRAFNYLLLGKANPHKLILNLNNSHAETNKFWASFVKPDFLLIIDYKPNIEILEKLISNTIDKKGQFVFNSKTKAKLIKKLGKYDNQTVYGEEKGCDLVIKHSKDYTKLYYDNYIQKIKRNFIPGITPEIIGGALAGAIANRIGLIDAVFALLKFEMPIKLINKLKLNLSDQKVSIPNV